MTNGRGSKEMGDTCIKEMISIFAREFYGRRQEIKSKYLEKGNEREEDSITLLSRYDKRFYKKNDKRLNNLFFTGEPDIFIGQSIENADETDDTKSSWSLMTFLEARNSKTLDSSYFYQGQVYMNLTGAKQHTVAYCLVNGTASQIMKEKKALLWDLGETDPVYKEKCKQIEINHIFDLEAFINENPFFEFDNEVEEWIYDIPMEQRIHKVTFPRDESVIAEMQGRVTMCRAWMNQNLFKNSLVAA